LVNISSCDMAAKSFSPHNLCQCCEPFLGLLPAANVMPWRDFLLANAVSSSWVANYGLGAYWTGREFEQLQGRAVVLLVIMGMLASSQAYSLCTGTRLN
jgi:hypothetical protein